MKEKILKFTGNIPKYLKTALNSACFPFATAAVALACYYLGWDMVAIYFIGVSGILTLLLCEELTPLFTLFLFLNVIVSKINSPSDTVGSSDYYFHTAVYVQIIIIISAFVSTIFYRIYKTVKLRQFKLTPAFWGLCALAATLFLNGIFCEGYDPLNLVYGLFMAFFFLAIFALMKDNFCPCEKTFIKIALSFFALSILLVTELGVAYLTTDGLIDGNGFNRGHLMFGWGVYNTMGMLLVICIPAVCYLAGKFKYGYIFYIYGFILFAGAYLSASRQAMVGATIIIPVCVIYLLVKGKNKLANGIITGIGIILVAVLAGVLWDKISAFFDRVFTGTFTGGMPNGSGRWNLWKIAIKQFASAPLFGTGFYVDIPLSKETVGLDIIPLMYHNTYMQLLGSCGILGLIAYAVHRTQTVISYFKKPDYERTFIAFTLAALLIVNLFDNHLFYILPTLVYSSLIGLLIKSEVKTE